MEQSNQPIPKSEPKQMVMGTTNTIVEQELADPPHLVRNLLSITFVTVFLLGAFVGAYLLKQYLLY